MTQAANLAASLISQKQSDNKATCGEQHDRYQHDEHNSINFGHRSVLRTRQLPCRCATARPRQFAGDHGRTSYSSNTTRVTTNALFHCKARAHEPGHPAGPSMTPGNMRELGSFRLRLC
jgi:hypothetical protein